MKKSEWMKGFRAHQKDTRKHAKTKIKELEKMLEAMERTRGQDKRWWQLHGQKEAWEELLAELERDK